MEFRLQAALSRSRLSLNSESKLQLQAELDVPRRTDGAVPDAEIGARDVRIESRESAAQSVLATLADERVPAEHTQTTSSAGDQAQLSSKIRDKLAPRTSG